MNGAGLTPGSVAGLRTSGSGRIMGTEACVHNKLAEVRGFAESDRGGFDEEVLGGWIRGKDVGLFKRRHWSVDAPCANSLHATPE